MAACCRLPVCGVFMSKPLGLAMRLHLLCHLRTDVQNAASQLLLHIDTVSDNKKPFVITGLGYSNCLGFAQGLKSSAALFWLRSKWMEMQRLHIFKRQNQL